MPKKKAKESRYIRVSENVKQDKFIEMSKRVHAGELEWSHYAIDGNICYHFYLKKTL